MDCWQYTVTLSITYYFTTALGKPRQMVVTLSSRRIARRVTAGLSISFRIFTIAPQGDALQKGDLGCLYMLYCVLPLWRMLAICTLYCPLVTCHYETSRFEGRRSPK